MKEWYFQVMGQELGPFSAAELKTKVDSGQIQSDTMVRRGVDGKWLFAERVKGLLPAKPEPPPVTARPKSSATMPVVQHVPPRSSPATMPLSGDGPPPGVNRMVSISLVGDDDESDATKGPSVEFYDFVGFREAISPVLHHAVRQYQNEHRLTMTQINRRALAAFIARPDLASDLMITNMSVIPQPVNDKSNAGGRDPISDRDRVEHATFRLTIFNCSKEALDVTGGEFVPESVDVFPFEEVGTKPQPAIDHKGHAVASLDGAEVGKSIPIKLSTTVPPLAATSVTVWFRGTSKPSLAKVRGQLRLEADGEIAVSESFTVIMHSDSP